MKKIFFFAMLAMLTMSAKPQDTTVYQSVFGDSITKWEGILVDNAVNQFMQYTKGDDTAIIDGQKYYIIKDSTEVEFRAYSDFSPCYVRESMMHDKLYLRFTQHVYNNPPVITSEILVMDLTLQVGDTLDTESWKQCEVIGRRPGQPIMVDSIFYMDGRKWMRTNCIAPFYCLVNVEYDTLYFIEGVGPSMGICYPDPATHKISNYYWHAPAVWCHTKDSVWDFHYRYYYSVDLLDEYAYSETYFQCGFYDLGVGIVPIKEKGIGVYPNPTSDMLTVYGLSSPECKYKVVSMSGVVVSEGFISDDNSIIDMSGFCKGTYILWVCDGEQTTIKKIVKL